MANQRGSDEARPLLEFGERVRACRVERGLSQEALADAADLHRTYVGSVERGERNVALLNILRIAVALGIDAADLVGGLTVGP